jgi:hypothetical protein
VVVVVVVEVVVDHNHKLVEDYAFAVLSNTVVVVVQIQVKDHTMDFVDKHIVEMDVHQYSIRQLYHYIHNEHHWHTFVVAVVAVD